MRYFHQTPDYWLDHSTLQDWDQIWSRELVNQPPAESFLAAYFEYEAPDQVAGEDVGPIDLGLPDIEE